MGAIHKHSTQSRNLDIMTNKNWTCILTSDDRVLWEVVSDCLVADMTSASHETPSRVNQI